MSTIVLSITNFSGVANDQVYIGFWCTQLAGSITLNSPGNAIAMQTENLQSIQSSNTWYKLSDIRSVELGVETSGRIYVSYYDTFKTVNGGMPSIFPVTGSKASSMIFDKIELTFDGTPTGVADLTAIDFWSIPMSLVTYKNAQIVGSLEGIKTGSNAKDIYNDLKDLTDPVASDALGKYIESAYVKGSHVKGLFNAQSATVSAVPAGTTGSSEFIRVIGPNLYPPFGDPDNPKSVPGQPFTPYENFLSYYRYLVQEFGPGTKNTGFTKLGDGTIAHIKGSYGGSTAGQGPAYEAQSFDFKATFDADMNLTLKGSAGKFTNQQTISVKWYDMLAPSGSYGANPTVSINGNSPVAPKNDVYAWVLGDFFGGINIGAVGSAVAVNKTKANPNGTKVGDLPSSDWFSLLPGQNLLFSALWKGTGKTNFWNRWAEKLNNKSDAYNFAYAERFSAPQISLDPGVMDTLEVVLLGRP